MVYSNIFSKSDTSFLYCVGLSLDLWKCIKRSEGIRLLSILIKKRKYIWTSYAVRLRADMLFLALTTAVWLVTRLRNVSLEWKVCCWTVCVRCSRREKQCTVLWLWWKNIGILVGFPAVITFFFAEIVDVNRLSMETVVLCCFYNCSQCNIVAYLGIQFYIILVRNTELRYFKYWAMKGLSRILQFRCSCCSYSREFRHIIGLPWVLIISSVSQIGFLSHSSWSPIN
jgi:hypothetical protein